MSKQYRVYIRFNGHHCIRFIASGDGIVTSDGLELFEWARDPQNIDRLRNRCIHTHEIDDYELPKFLARKILKNKCYAARQMDTYETGNQMLKAFEEGRSRFTELRHGVDKLEAIASSEGIMTIPRTTPRKGLDAAEWLYLLDVDRKTLEVYDFKYLNNSEPNPTMTTVLGSNATEPPGYYIKLELSELQAMWRNDWITRHQTHANTLRELWVNNLVHLRSVPRTNDLSFSVLYGSIFHGKTTDGKTKSWSTRMTRAKLARAMTMVRRAQASRISYQREKTTESEKERHLQYFHWAWKVCQNNPSGVLKRLPRRHVQIL
ncbi:hypothetical protein F5X99DRAFT_394794 [Biscogniauxia marginata]|nr:hypothetical protein F5X99DRAFT_394794 [Biscogniauxia marginata]